MENTTVLMPIHNAQKTLRAALHSTLRAMDKEDKLHVFLDNCSDLSLELIKSIRDERLVVVGYSNQTLGVKTTLNRLLDSVETNYVSRMDADDISFPWRFLRQKRLLLEYDFVFSTAIVFGRQLRPFPILPQYPIPLSGLAAHAALLFANPYVHPSMSAHTEKVIKLGGYTEDFAQDYGLWIRASIADFKLYRDFLPSIGYRFHPSQISGSKQWAEMRSADVSIPLLKKELEKLILLKFPMGDRDGILTFLYSQAPFLRLEHKGLPKLLRAWKDSNRFEM